jgi:RHS repeat-associated protein
VLRQFLAAALCAVLAFPAFSTVPPSGSTPSNAYDTHSVSRVNFRVAETLSRTRIWSSSKKILLHFRVVWQLSGEQHWSYAECSAKNAVGSVVTYDHDAFGVLIHQTGTTPNNYLYSGEQFDPDLNLYYNRARYLNTSTGRFWTFDTDEGNDESPLSLHKYLYGQSDPIGNVDPSGNQIDELMAGITVGLTINSMSTLNAAQIVLAALPIPDYPAVRAARQLVGAIYAESGTQGTGGEDANEKLAIGETFLYQAEIMQTCPKYNNFGDGTLWGAIQTSSTAVGGARWNEVMNGTSRTCDLRSRDTLAKTLSYQPTRLHLINSVLAVNEFGLSGNVVPGLPELDQLGGRIPIAFNKAFNRPPNKRREEKIGRIGTTSFYGFKPGRECQ